MGGKGSKACPEVGNIIEAMIYDDDGDDQGFVIIEVKRHFAPGEQGRFIQGDYVTASDAFYRYWVESGDGQDTKVDGMYHLCKGHAPDCTAKSRSGATVVHLGKWRTLKEEDLDASVLTHYTDDAVGDLTRFGKRADTPASPGEGGLPWPKGKPGEMKIRKDPPRTRGRGPEEKPGGAPKEKPKEDDVSTVALREELEALKRRLAEKEKEEAGGLPKEKKKKMKEKEVRKKPPGGEGFTALPLGKDARLPGSPPSDPSSDETSSEESEDSKKKEVKEKRKRKRSRSRKPSRDPKGDKEGKDKKEKKKRKKEKKGKKKKKKEKDKGPFGIAKTEEWSKCESSHTSGSEDSSSSRSGFRKASGGMDHHLRLVAYAKKCPGHLAVRLLRKMVEAVGFSSGANLLQSPTSVGAVPASAHLYYLLGCSGFCYHVNIIMLIRSRISLSKLRG